VKRLVRHAMCALYPALDGLPGVGDTDLDGFLHHYRHEAPRPLVASLVAGSVVFALSPPLTIGALRPSFLLDADALDRHAHAVATHRAYLVRQSVLVVKMVAGLCWGRTPAVRARFGLDPYDPDPGSWRAR